MDRLSRWLSFLPWIGVSTISWLCHSVFKAQRSGYRRFVQQTEQTLFICFPEFAKCEIIVSQNVITLLKTVAYRKSSSSLKRFGARTLAKLDEFILFSSLCWATSANSDSTHINNSRGFCWRSDNTL